MRYADSAIERAPDPPGGAGMGPAADAGASWFDGVTVLLTAILAIPARPADGDLSAERLQVHVGASRPERERRASSAPHARPLRPLHRQGRVELTVVRAHAERRIHRVRHGEDDVAVMAVEAVAAVVRDRAVEADVAVDGCDVDCRAVDMRQADRAVRRFGADFPVRALDVDSIVDRADVDLAAAAFNRDLAFDGVGGDRTRSLRDRDVPADVLDGHVAVRPFDADL